MRASLGHEHCSCSVFERTVDVNLGPQVHKGWCFKKQRWACWRKMRLTSAKYA